MYKKFLNEFESGKELSQYLSIHLKKFFEKSKVDFAYLGGSWSMDRNNWWSDIDIFVSIPDFSSMDVKGQAELTKQLHIKISNILKHDKVDISILENIPLHIQFEVIQDGLVIYEKNDKTRKRFIEKLLPKYWDHMIWYKKLISQSEKSFLRRNSE